MTTNSYFPSHCGKTAAERNALSMIEIIFVERNPSVLHNSSQFAQQLILKSLLPEDDDMFHCFKYVEKHF